MPVCENGPYSQTWNLEAISHVGTRNSFLHAGMRESACENGFEISTILKDFKKPLEGP
jgi:hypothetical protein